MMAGDPPRPRTTVRVHLLTAAILVSAYAGLSAAQIEATSATRDEPWYLCLGQQVYAGHGFRELVPPRIPVLSMLLQGWAVAVRHPQLPANNDPGFAAAVRTARYAAVATCGVPLVLVLYGWVGTRYGWWPGRLAGALAALSPFLVGHGALATTDVCFALFGFLGVIALSRYDDRPTRGRWWAAAVAAGLALAAKQSAVFLLPVALVLFARQARAAGAGLVRSLWRAGCRTAGFGSVAFVVCWGCHGFAAYPLLEPGLGHPTYWKVMGRGGLAVEVVHALETVPVPLPVNTFLGQAAHGIRGHESYLCGEVRRKGWWYFFPVAVAVKATPAELALAAFAVVAVLTPGTWADRRGWVAAAAAVVFGLICLASPLNLGVRYASALYPLGMVLACGWLARNLPPRPALWAGLTAAGVAAQGWAAGVAFRDELSYFNPLAGGPAGGHRYLADSDLDWGQGLPTLRTDVRARNPAKWVLAYYGYQPGWAYAVDPAAYGLTGFVPWRQATAADLAAADLLAVSTSLLVGLENEPSGEFAPLRGVTPAARSGTGFWLFDLTDPVVRGAAVAARLGCNPGPLAGPGRAPRVHLPVRLAGE